MLYKYCDMNAQEEKALKQKLEKEGEKIAEQVLKSGRPINESKESLVNAMAQGCKEFTEKTGRNLTYSEMRELYG